MSRRKPKICSVHGCTHERKNWQALCDSCFIALRRFPDIRAELIDAFKARHTEAWLELGKRAGAALNLSKPTIPATQQERASHK